MRKRAPSQPRTVTCAICGAAFQTQHSQGKFCSPSCTREGARKCWRDYTARNLSARREGCRKIYEKHADSVIARTQAYHHTAAGKAASKVSDKHQRAKFPEKIQARQTLGIAVRQGLVTKKPCERCGAKNTHGHHPDYSKPLEVIWLCPRCHSAEHKALRARKDAA